MRNFFLLSVKIYGLTALFCATLCLAQGVAYAQKRFDMDPYLNPSIENLAKLYWAIGTFDLNDYEKTTTFLRFFECHIFGKYRDNEFEWNRIVEMTRKYLNRNRNKFSTRFEFIVQLTLGKYDEETREFAIIAPQYPGIRLIEVMANEWRNDRTNVCGLRGYISGYPKNVVLNLNRPLYITHIPMPFEEAREYVEQRVNKPRYMYLAIHVDFYKHMGIIEGGITEPSFAVMYARLDHYGVYYDLDLKHELFSETFKKAE